MHHRREPENHQCAARNERRVQTLGQREPIEHENHGAAADNPDEGAQESLLGEDGKHVAP